MLSRELRGDDMAPIEQLLVMILDELRTANWQRSKDGAKGRNRPRRLSPFARPAGERYGRTDRTPTDVVAYLQRLNPPEEVTRG